MGSRLPPTPRPFAPSWIRTSSSSSNCTKKACRRCQQQKYLKAKQLLEKVLAGPSKELNDRAQMHLRIIDQRMNRPQAANLRTPEEYYQLASRR